MGNKTVFEKEREEHLDKAHVLIQKLNESKNLLYKNLNNFSKYDPEVLTGPKHKREEIK